MALIKCVECGKEISDKAPSCPHCGCPASAMKENVADSVELTEAFVTCEDTLEINDGKTKLINKFKNLKIVVPVAVASVILIILGILFLTHTICLRHSWNEATCITPKTCIDCGKTEGEVVDHFWTEANCLAPKTCKWCAVTEGEKAGHTWEEATCSTPKTCKNCGATEGNTNEHSWSDATCQVPKTCKWCNTTSGDKVNHLWSEATCKTPQTCEWCNTTNGDIVSHMWSAATCQKPKMCKWCDASEGGLGNHSWNAATCTSPKKCKTCGTTEGGALGHNWSDATCDSPKTCQTCGMAEGSKLNHSITNGFCSICGLLDQAYWNLAADGYYYLKSVLLNPDSLDLRNAAAGLADGKQAIEFYYVAQNQMGGYSSDLVYFWYDSYGDLIMWDSYVSFDEITQLDVNDIP